VALLLLISILCVTGLALWRGLNRAGATHLWPAGLLVLTAPLDVYRTSAGGFNLSVFRLSLGVAVIATIAGLIRERRRPAALPAVFLIYALLLVWQAASVVLVTPVPSLGYRFASQYLAGLIAAGVIAETVRKEDAHHLVTLYLLGAVVPLIAGAWRVFSISGGGSGDLPGLSVLPVDPTIQAARLGGSFLLNGVVRMQATFADPNHYGFYIGTVLAVALAAAAATWIAKAEPNRRAVLSYGLVAAAAGAAVLASYSRSAWLLAFVGVVVGVVLAGRSIWTRRRAITTGIGAVVALAVVSPLLLSRIFGRAEGALASNQAHASTAHIAYKLFVAHPLLGVGLGDYGRHAGQPPLVSSAHSTFLTVAAELGAPGVALLAGAIVFASACGIRSARRAVAGDRLVQAGFVAAFIGLAVANALYEVWMDDFQWVLFGTLLALTDQPRISFAIPRLSVGSKLKRHRAKRTAYGPAVD
jgi:hypothetical protein